MLRVTFLILLCCASVARADVGCVDRLTAEAAAQIGGAQLPDLRYECVVMDSGRSLWVGEAGSATGDAVLLVHGLGNNAHRDWRNLIPALAPTHRVLVVDLPGFGASEPLAEDISFDNLAATLEELLRRRQIERAHVVGHSLGGALGLHFAWVYPQRVDRLVLVDVAGILQRSVYARFLMQQKLTGGSQNRLLAALKAPLNALGRHLLRDVENKFDLSSWLARNPETLRALVGSRTEVATAISLVEHNFAPALRAVEAPTTIVWGREDPIAPLRTGQLLAARLRNARLHVLDGVGHVPMTDAAPAFNELLISTLSTATLGPEPAPAPAELQQHGDVVCRNKANVHYTGRFRSLRLSECAGVKIENAQIEYLQIDDSTAELYDVEVTSARTAMFVRGSTVSGTAIAVTGEVGIRADDSVLDLAGASVRGSRRALHLSRSASIYFSVSEIQSPGEALEAHDIWSRGRLQGPRTPSR